MCRKKDINCEDNKRNTIWNIVSDGLVMVGIYYKSSFFSLRDSITVNPIKYKSTDNKSDKDQGDRFYKIVPILYSYKFLATWNNTECELKFASGDGSSEKIDDISKEALTLWSKKFYPFLKDKLLKSLRHVNKYNNSLPNVLIDLVLTFIFPDVEQLTSNW